MTPLPYTVHAPTAAGTHTEQFGWRVLTPSGWTAYSGNERGARAYARAMNVRLGREHHRRVQRAAAQSMADATGAPVECQGTTLAPRRHGRCTVTYRGRPATARHAERLPNGEWRADLTCGLVGMYDEDPVLDPAARQLN